LKLHFYFCRWFNSLDQYKHKIFIAGNHDWGFQTHPEDVSDILKWYPNITYLQDSSVEIEGIKIYGSPWQPEFFQWAFNLQRGPEIQEKWDMIPLDTDILITHGPVYGHGDLDGTDSTFTYTYEITPSGTSGGFGGTLGFYIIVLAIIVGVVVLGFSIQEPWFVIIGGMFLMMTGIYSINSGVAGYRDMFMTWGIGLFEIGIGAYLSIKSGMELNTMEVSG
jgi:hypothetical protein